MRRILPQLQKHVHQFIKPRQYHNPHPPPPHHHLASTLNLFHRQTPGCQKKLLPECFLNQVVPAQSAVAGTPSSNYSQSQPDLDQRLFCGRFLLTLKQDQALPSHSEVKICSHSRSIQC